MSETATYLKPCPFCGGEAATGEVKYSETHAREQGWGQRTFFFANCVLCGACNKGLVGNVSVDQAIAKWNGRAFEESTAKEMSTNQPTYFRTAERPPTLEDSVEGLVLASRGDLPWYDKDWADVAKYPGVYKAWMPMPPAPKSAEEEAFEAFMDSEFGRVRFQANDDSCRKVWNAAKAHFTKPA